jgi:glycosyltransferase involved in cell wall biosynthesis
MRITFLIADQKKQHEGVVRPFLNFVKGIEDKSEVSFALLRCGDELVDYIKTNFCASVIVSDNQNDLIDKLTKLKPQFVVADDYSSRLKLLNAIKRRVRTNVVVYVQILYGTHAISNCYDLSFLPFKERFLFSFLKFVPFSILSRRYVDLISKCDLVVANSKVTATLLHTLYNLDAGEVIYPPTDTQVFKPTIRKQESNEIVLYLGSHLGDTEKDFVERIVRCVSDHKCVANLFGNSRLASILKDAYDDAVLYHRNLKDEELAEIYTRSLITLCPQRWEQFGLVPVESMACGTPVLAFDRMGPGETIINGKTGWIAKNKQEFLNMLDSILRNKESGVDRNFMRKHVEENFSVDASVKKLEEVLTVIING